MKAFMKLSGIIVSTHFQMACSTPLPTKNIDIPKMQFIRGGSFLMGSPITEKGRNINERQHIVRVKKFWIGKTEVSFAQWQVCVDDGGCQSNTYPSAGGWNIRGDRPVVNINMHDVNEYTTWLSKKTGHKYRLPTEAEWEYAARAGTKTAYVWGDNIGENRASCDFCGPGVINTATVSVYSLKAYGGLHNMLGNVKEWTCSIYGIYDNNNNELKCAISNNKKYRVIRGGSFGNSPEDIRSASRNYAPTTRRSGYLGFRVVKSDK